MVCSRCSGLVVAECVQDREGSGPEVVMGRCLQCGNVEDAVTVRNREMSSLPQSAKMKVRRTPDHPFPPLALFKG